MRILLLAIGWTAISLFSASESTAQSESQKDRIKRQKKYAEIQHVMMRISNITHNQPLREELEIVDDQVKDLQKISQEFQKDLQVFSANHSKEIMQARQLFQAGKRVEATKLSDRYQEKMFEISSKHFEQIEKKLLPHQVSRIRQISRQETLKHMSGFKDEFGIVYALADEIGLSPTEKKKLRTAIEKARSKYYSELVKLKEKTHREILKSIPANNRDKVRELVGDFYDQVQTELTSKKASKSKD